jgi:hypothetical protein
VVSKAKCMMDVSIALFARFAGDNRIADLVSMLAKNSLHLRFRHHRHVPADRRRLLHLQRTATVLAILEAA